MAFGKISAFVFVICALSAFAPQSAFAAPSSVVVPYHDVDPNSDEGARVLLRRIERAAREVCGRDLASRYPSVRRAYRHCTMHTMYKAIDELGHDRLREAFGARYGHI